MLLEQPGVVAPEPNNLLSALVASAAYPFLQSYPASAPSATSFGGAHPPNVQQYALNLFAHTNQILSNLINTNSLSASDVSAMIKANPLLPIAMIANCDATKVKKEQLETVTPVANSSVHSFGASEHSQAPHSLDSHGKHQPRR